VALCYILRPGDYSTDPARFWISLPHARRLEGRTQTPPRELDMDTWRRGECDVSNFLWEPAHLSVTLYVGVSELHTKFLKVHP
jgi:hypothetical protein